ncbi:MAG: glutamate--tRNA ligase [Ignavibacteriales bacterium CG_4_9_14_3_um_filter_30_11]|nr:MAG: glutamate--tRNA ligase [Ignavibacteriales bacterium CG_4_9_14_3_um_filter_30_11]
MINKEVRVRFAPSPTGYLHIGGLRTALYNYLFAKNNKGKFILRIEDTDRNRYVDGALDNLISTLNWAGLTADEGPETGGIFGPYLQSERLDIYKSHIKNLLVNKKAYYCFCTQERLRDLREKQKQEGLQTKYDKHCLSLSQNEIDINLRNNLTYVIRLNIESGKDISFTDLIRGEVVFNTDTIDDQVLIKSDGFPTYHFANVVDDHLMQITHVIRGEEWISSTPKHVLLYDYFNWEKPNFAHLPLLLNPDKSKLSKRQGDVAVEDYRDKGYLKDALLNFIALLGWNAGDDKEFYKMDQLINSFSLERVNKSGAVFNTEKLDWLNAEHLRKLTNEEILNMLKQELINTELVIKNLSDAHLLLIIEAMKERVSFVKEFITSCPYFYSEPTEYDECVIKKKWKEDSPKLLKLFSDGINKIENPSKEDFESTLKNICVEKNIGLGKLIHPLRLALSGVGIGPGIFDLTYILGKEETIKRIDKALEIIIN